MKVIDWPVDIIVSKFPESLETKFWSLSIVNDFSENQMLYDNKRSTLDRWSIFSTLGSFNKYFIIHHCKIRLHPWKKWYPFWQFSEARFISAMIIGGKVWNILKVSYSTPQKRACVTIIMLVWIVLFCSYGNTIVPSRHITKENTLLSFHFDSDANSCPNF